MMNKEAKKNYVEEMKKNFTSNESVMIAQYQGLNVNELDELRKQLREKGILFKITKNRITKIATKASKKGLEKYFIGPTAAALSSDPITTAKILTKFSKSNNKLKIIAGFMDGKVFRRKRGGYNSHTPIFRETKGENSRDFSHSSTEISEYFTCAGSKIANLARAKSLKKLIHRK